MDTRLNIRQLACGTVLCAAGLVPAVSASEELYQGALVEDRNMGEIRDRLDSIRDRQEESNIFSTNEIGKTKEMGGKVGKVRDENLKSVITELGATVRTDDAATKKTHYLTAKGEYETAVSTLNAIRKETAKTKGNYELRQLLNRQKDLLDETKKLDDQMANAEKAPAKAAEDALKLANKEKELEKDTKEATNPENQPQPQPQPENKSVSDKMNEAADALKKMDLPKAEKLQNEIVKDLEKALNDQTQGDQDQMNQSAEMAKLEGLDQDLKKMEDALQNSADNGNNMSDQNRQDMALKMDDIKQDMQKSGTPEQPQGGEVAKDLEKAQDNVMAKQDQQAKNNVSEARNQVKSAMQQLAQKQAQPPGQPQPNQPPQPPQPNQPPGMMAMDEQKPRTGAGSTEKSGKGAEGGDWTARLPERERGPLMAARQAKFPENVAPEVKAYFVEIAK